MFNWDSMKNKIILADNKDVMKDIPDKKIVDFFIIHN